VKQNYVEAGGKAEDFTAADPKEIVTLKKPSVTIDGTVIVVKSQKPIVGLPSSVAFELTVRIGGELVHITGMTEAMKTNYEAQIASAVQSAILTSEGSLAITKTVVTKITSSTDTTVEAQKNLDHAITVTLDPAVYDRRRTLAGETIQALIVKMKSAVADLKDNLNANNGALLSNAKATYVSAGGKVSDFVAKTSIVVSSPAIVDQTLPPLSGTSIITNFSLVLATLATILIFAF